MNRFVITTNRWTLVAIFVAIKASWLHATLLYPASSVLQLVASVSVPIVDLPPQRRINFDWGLQMNYDMPFNLSSFYNVPIWPSGQNLTKRASDSKLERHHRFDFGLLDFYEYLEQSFESYGFHKTCLLLCICQLLQETFDWRNFHFIKEFLEFLGRPSKHLKNLSTNKPTKMEKYILAEARGAQVENCANFYTLCDQSPLNVITKIVI